MSYKLPSPDVVLTKSLHDLDAEYYYPGTLRSEIAAAEQRGREQREAELMTVGMEPSLPTHAKGPHFSAEQLAAARLQGAEEDKKRIEELEQSLAFYERRVDLMQQWQSKMRDPERTIVCDIIANGATLPASHAGERYKIPQASAVNQGLIRALQPFVLENSSEEYMTLVVRTADITRARATIAEAEAHTGEQI